MNEIKEGERTSPSPLGELFY